MGDEFRLNRSVSKAQTAQEAADHSSYYKETSWEDRLKIAAYLNSVAYNYDINTPPRMDRTVFKAKSMSS